MALKVLKQQAETPVGGGSKLFPKGKWLFTLISPAPEFMHNAATTAADKTPRASGDDGEILSIWLGNAQPVGDGQQDSPGDMKFFQDFVIRDGDVEIGSLDLDNAGSAGWQIQRDARLLANLAIALGATTEVTQGKLTYVEVVENFVELLKEGSFDGQQVIGTVEHEAWSNKTSGKSGTNVFISGFEAV
jgi:hypothetical protein